MSNKLRQVHRATRQGWLESVMRGTSEQANVAPSEHDKMLMCPPPDHPAAGKDYADMTPDERATRCACGVKGWLHTDGWDGRWLGCEEARRRNGL